MDRFARLMAAALAALFTGALAAPAYATGGGCDSHSALRTFGTGGCKAEGTKFDDLDADGVRDAGEPGLAGFRIWADYDNDGASTPASPTTTRTRAAPTRSPASTRPPARPPPAPSARRGPTACARSSRAGAAPGTGRARTRAPRPRAALPPATAAVSVAAGGRSTRRRRPRPPARTSATTARPGSR
jgi:hypothetical protein